jgi:hypothetical protein
MLTAKGIVMLATMFSRKPEQWWLGTERCWDHRTGGDAVESGPRAG